MPQFNRINDVLEWRLPSDRSQPFATILRWFTSGDDEQEKEFLVVTRLSEKRAGVCHVAYIDAHANPEANALARRAADETAESFDCAGKPYVVGEVSDAAWFLNPDAGYVRPEGLNLGETPSSEATTWQIVSSGEGSALNLTRNGDDRLLTLFCPNGSDRLILTIGAFDPLADKHQISLVVNGKTIPFVADTASDTSKDGVTGRGELPADLANLLGGTGEMVISYGAQESGPHRLPPPEIADTFASACHN